MKSGRLCNDIQSLLFNNMQQNYCAVKEKCFKIQIFDKMLTLHKLTHSACIGYCYFYLEYVKTPPLSSYITRIYVKQHLHQGPQQNWLTKIVG